MLPFQKQEEELKTKHINDLTAEKEMIKQQFEAMTKNFETEKEELEEKLVGRTIDISGKIEALDEKQKMLEASEVKLSALVDSEKKLTDQLSQIMKKSEQEKENHNLALTHVKALEESKTTLENLLVETKASMVTVEKHKSVKDLLTSTIDECENLKNGRMGEKQEIQKQEKELNAAQSSLARQTKQVTELREELAKHEEEAKAAASSPWEGEDWEGLTSTEIYEVLRRDLVPAQQARLLKLCVTELEDQLNGSKTDFLKVMEIMHLFLKRKVIDIFNQAVAEVSTITDEKNKLEAKICFLEKDKETVKQSDADNWTDNIQQQTKSTKSLVAPAKFTAPVAPAEGRSSSGRSLRRSSR